MDTEFPRLIDPVEGSPLVREAGALVSTRGQRYPIIDGIPRFVPAENYADAFGEQWVRFPRTQLDSATGLTLSRDRLKRCLGHALPELSGQLVLEAGSGAGRFTELLLKAGVTLDSFDYSGAVAANARNNGGHPKLCLIQADVRQMPFPRDAYDLVVCLGVVQHTPDPEETLRALWSRVRPGGRLVFDHYRFKIRNYLPPPLGTAGIAYRRYFLGLPREQRFDAVKRVVDRWFPLIWKYRANYAIQLLLSRLNPVVNYYPHFGLKDRDMYYEWMLLDTHDAMTDVYKHRRTARGIAAFLQSLGAVEISVSNAGNGVEASCRKPHGLVGEEKVSPGEVVP
jgi:SAM-dependent methyltransferase